MPSTLGIVASHVNYIPPTFSVVPDKTTIKEGEFVTYTITTTNYNAPNIYATNSGTAINADLGPSPAFSRTIPLVGGSATFSVSAILNDTVSGQRTIIPNLRTGSTTGPIVATASTVMLNDRLFTLSYTSPSQNTNKTTQLASNIPNKDGRWFKLTLTTTQQGGSSSAILYVDGVGVAARNSVGSSSVFVRLNSGSSVSLYTWYSMFNSVISNGSVTGQVTVAQEVI